MATQKKNKIEKEEKENPPTLTKKELDKREEKQTKWVIAIIGIVILSILIPYAAVKISKTFNYANVDWQIQKEGDRYTGVKWYVSSFEKKTTQGTSYGTHTTYLRNDPRKNEVFYEIEDLSFSDKVIFSLDPKILEYDDQVLGTMALGQILNALPFIEERIVSTTNSSYAKENDLKWNTCNNKLSGSTIFEVIIGEDNRIYKKDEDCYVLEMKSEEDYLLVAEKFVVEIIKQMNP